MENSINNQFKMRRHGGQAHRATETSPGSYSVNQERTMANMGMAPTNYGTPLENDPGDKKTTGGTVEIGSGASNRLNEVVVSAKSPETIKKQVEQNISGSHSSAGNIRTATPERQKEIKSGKYTTPGLRNDMTNTELKIFEKKYGKK